MTPEEYVKECLPLSDPVGYQFCQVAEAAPLLGWNPEQIQQARSAITERYQNSPRLIFPKRPRYI